MFVYMYAIFLCTLILVRTAMPLHTQPHTHAHTYTHTYSNTHTCKCCDYGRKRNCRADKITGDLLALPVNKVVPTSFATFFSFTLLKML